MRRDYLLAYYEYDGGRVQKKQHTAFPRNTPFLSPKNAQ